MYIVNRLHSSAVIITVNVTRFALIVFILQNHSGQLFALRMDASLFFR